MTRNQWRGILRFGVFNAIKLNIDIRRNHTAPEHHLAVCAIAKNEGPFYYFTTKAPQRYTDVAYPDGAYLVFGREDAGLPEALLAANQEHCIRMPMRDTCRSLNLSNSVAVGVYEVLRQWDFPELLDHGHLRDYQWK